MLHVLPHRGGGAETYIDMLERLPGFEHRRFYLSSGRTKLAASRSVPARWGKLARSLSGVDLLHTHGDVATLITLPFLGRRPTVMTTHGLHLLRRSAGARGQLLALTARSAAARVHAVICTSTAEKEEFSRFISETELPKLRVIPNGVDPGPWAMEETERATVRRDLGIESGTTMGLFVGQLEVRKAPLLAADAAHAARAQGLPFVLVVAGAGPLLDELHARHSDALRILGHREDVQRLLGAADIYIQTSEREGMSYALLEAMSHALPVIGVDSPGVSDVVTGAGLLVPPGDESQLTRAISQLCLDTELRSEFGLKASRRIADRFSSERFLEATAAVYRLLLGDGVVSPRA